MNAIIDGYVTSFLQNKRLADRAAAQLSEEKLHIALDANTNSIAVIMKHVAGNLRSRWTDFLASDGEKPWRNRDDEFVDTYRSRAELLEDWESGWRCVIDVLRALTTTDLERTVMIRGEPHTVPLAASRSLSHCGYHVGQIVMIARILAADTWETLTIPRGESAAYNQRVWGKTHDAPAGLMKTFSKSEAMAFAEAWIAAWNAHDVDRVLSHYTDNFDFISPLAQELGFDPNGKVRGKERMREYWSTALKKNPDLKMKLIDVLTGPGSLVVLFESNHVRRAIDVLWFDDAGMIERSSAHRAV